MARRETEGAGYRTVCFFELNDWQVTSMNPVKSVLSRTCRYEIRCSHLHTIYIDEAVYHADIYDSGQVRKSSSRQIFAVS